MDQKPWYQIRKAEPSFPFLFKDNTFYNFNFHWHELLEFVYILKGRIRVTVDGKTYDAAQGDMVFINSGAIHGFLDGSPDTVVSTYQVGLELFDQALVELRDGDAGKLVFCRKTLVSPREDGDLHRRLEDLILSIRKEYYAREKGFRLAIRSRLYDLALIFLRDIPERVSLPGEGGGRKYNRQILERVFSFIHENFSDPDITLEEAASAAALSKFYFTRYFKQQTGQTFHTYLSRVRISQAEEYLAETDRSVTDIAYQSGFSSLKTFNRIFKAYTGTSPSGYRTGRQSRRQHSPDKPGQFLR
jgi:AraC-like DNA-binding protein